MRRPAKPKPRRAPGRDRTLAPNARRVLARGLVVRALRAAGLHHVVDRRGSLTVLAGLGPQDVPAVTEGIVALLRSRGWGVSFGRDVVHDFVTARAASATRRDGTALIESDNGVEPEFVLVEDMASIPPLLAAACDGIAVLGDVDAALVGAAFRAVLGGAPERADLEFAATLPLHRLPLAIRGGRPVAEAMAAIRKLAALEPMLDDSGPDAKVANPSTASASPRLEDLHGLGEAGEWARSLIADLAEYREGRLPWADMDRGALLVGPPGVGKTMFASALAATAGVPLHAHSLAKWQARGHLGDLLKAMAKGFDTARRDAPCILFVDEIDEIDEIDAIGSRDDPGDRYAAYTRQVIDSFLEQLDGTVGREGVVVVGATNLPALIDPAILRPGRLDRTVTIPLPDAAGREGILRHHLRGSLAGEALDGVAGRMRGFSGADVERAVRDARRSARTGRREMSVADLIAALPPAVILSEPAFRRACVHEAGHWVVGLELGALAGMEPVSATVSRHVVGGAGGWTDFSRDEGADRTREFSLAEISILLAGTAAEEVVLGDRGHGVGGRAGSDLHQATAAAARLELSHGLGTGLAHLLEADRGDLVPTLLRDPALRGRVESVLAACLDRARAVVLERRHEVEAAAAVLSLGLPPGRTNSCHGRDDANSPSETGRCMGADAFRVCSRDVV